MKKSTKTTVETKHGCLWVVLPDSIDMDNYLKIEELVVPELEKSPKDVVLDFSHTKALFSSGIGLVVRLKKRVNELGQKLSLVGMENRIMEGLENVGLDRVFERYDSEDAFAKSQDNDRS